MNFIIKNSVYFITVLFNNYHPGVGEETLPCFKIFPNAEIKSTSMFSFFNCRHDLFTFSYGKCVYTILLLLFQFLNMHKFHQKNTSTFYELVNKTCYNLKTCIDSFEDNEQKIINIFLPVKM